MQSMQDGINNELTKQYYLLNDRLEKIKVKIFQHSTEPNFLDCMTFMMRDIALILGFEQYSLNLKYDDDSGLKQVIEDWQLPSNIKKKPESNFSSKKNYLFSKSTMIQKQGPKGLKLESDLDSRVKKIVMRGLGQFRELKVDK